MGGRTTFPRLSGGIVLDSFSITSFITGLLAVLPAGAIVLLGSAGPESSRSGSAAAIVWGLTVLVFVCRFAQLAVVGDDEGGLFSGTAGPWSGTVLAAARLLVLWVAWLLPIVAWFLFAGEPQAPAGVGALGLGAFVPRVPLLLSIWSALGVVLSFAFVAVAVAAPGFGDLFSPGLWRTLFSGRLGELFTAIAGTLGPPLAVLVFFAPVGAALAPANPKLTLAAFVPFLLYSVGMVLTLHGKLCGAFSAASLAEEAEAEEPAATAEAHGLPGTAPPAGPAASAAAPPQAVPSPPPGDPRVLHDIWRTRFAAGDKDGAIAAAKEAIAAGLASGNRRIAAEVYRFHLDRLPELGLDRSALDVLADQLLRDGDVAAAAWTFSQALDADPADAKAFKGLLRVAEHHLEKAKAPFEAVRVYRYLLERAPGSPFADHARDLLADAERKAARPAAPQG